ncbi:MAG: N-6 DNA methylase [Trueperaceae bacterium]
MTFTNFIDSLFGDLARDDFYQGHSFPDYLERPNSERSGDEADIVDLRVTQSLLRSLGYQESEIEYNRAGAQGTRPDFKVAIPEYPRPCFIVEDKNTTDDRLLKHGPQLEGYMRAYGAAKGILLDGKRLVAFDLAETGLSTSADVSLYNIVRSWRGESMFAAGASGAEALTAEARLILQAFYARFNREAYAHSARLVNDLTHTRDGSWHDLDGSTWPSESVIPVVSANENMDAFTENIRGLIREVQLDVEAQLNLRLDEHAEYEQQLTVNPDDPGATFDETFAKELTALVSDLRVLGLPDAVIETTRERLVEQYRRHTLRTLAATFKEALGKALAEVEVEQEQTEASSAPEVPAASSAALFDVGDVPRVKVRPGKSRAKQSLTTGIEASLARLDRVITTRNEQRVRLEREFIDVLETQRAYRLWRDKVATLLMRTDEEPRLRREFAAQSAYVLIIRLLLIRISEDKGILDRMFTNGGLSIWFRDVEPRYLKYAQGRGTDYLLEMAYASAQHVYKHFYSQRELFDWYRPDRNLVITVLHRLAGYDLQRIDHDLIGHIYSGYVQDEHKHETGMYYTPPEVVEYMLDRVGWTGSEITGSRLLDPACGSGTFLVVAARRLLEAHRDYYRERGNDGIPVNQIQYVLNSIRDSIYGLDLNPFACYLAETNLLVQVLDEIKRALDANEPVAIDRFNVHNTDTLRYDATTMGVVAGTLAFPTEHLPVAEQIKLKAGDFKEGFRVTILNPPYVRADEGGEGLQQYRNAIKNEHPIQEVRDTLKRRWDLFIPFIAFAQYLLEPEGRMAVITSDSIEAVPYAQSLREQLVTTAQVDEVHFFPNQSLFADANVGSLILVTTAQTPSDTHETVQHWHSGPPTATPDKERTLNQQGHAQDVFRQHTSTLNMTGTIALEQICYVSYGVRLNSDERRFKGLFTKEDLISPFKDASHPKPYVEGKDIDAFEPTSIKYVEYGSGLRAPLQVSRPTFPALYDRPKLVAQRSVSSNQIDVAQVLLDDGTWQEDFLITNESGIILMPWNALAGVSNRSLPALNNKVRQTGEQTSSRFSLAYITGVLNTSTVSDHLRATRRHKIHVFPDDFKAIPIPDVSEREQAPVAERALTLHGLAQEFAALRSSGWIVNTDSRVAHAPLTLPAGTRALPLGTAKVRWNLTVHTPDANLNRLTVKGETIYRGATAAISGPSTLAQGALAYLARTFQGHQEATTFTVLESHGLRIPADPKDAAAALETIESREQEVLGEIERFHELRQELNELVAALYA